MAEFKITRGTQAAYNALQTKDPDTLYVRTDSHNIYLGSILLFEEDAFKSVSISGKTLTFTTHGANGTTGSKTLSLSDFATTEEVAAAIAAAAVQSDWEQTDNTATDYIKNKPRIKAGDGTYSTIEGHFNSKALGTGAHAEGYYNAALGLASHVEGYGASFPSVLLNGSGTTYTVRGAGVEVGDILTLKNNSTFYATVLSVSGSTITVDTSLGDGNLLVSRLDSYALGTGSHVEGCVNIAKNNYEHAEGQYNVSSSGSTSADKTISTIGIGTANNARKNAVDVRLNGDVYIDRIGNYNGTGDTGTLQDVISGIQTEIESVSGDIKTYTIEETTPSHQTGVAQQYNLIDSDGTTCGETITIPSNPDWKEDVSSSLDYIKNRPNIREGEDEGIIEGNINDNISNGEYAHAEGDATFAMGDNAHAEGLGVYDTLSLTGSDVIYTVGGGVPNGIIGSLLLYQGTIATVTDATKSQITLDTTLGTFSKATSVIWLNSGAIGNNSHVEGEGTIALNSNEHAQGQYNVSNTGKISTIHSIGIGQDDANRQNAVEVLNDGYVFIYGIGGYNGSDPGNAIPLQTVMQGIHQYTITPTTPDTGYLTAYQLKQDNSFVGAKINIPKDFLVKSGDVIDVVEYNGEYYDATDTEHENPLPVSQDGKYLDFVVNVQSGTATDEHIYILVSDLVDVYTGGNGIDISSGNVVSVVIDSNSSNGLSVSASGIALATATTSSAGAMSAADKTKLEGIASGAEVNQNAFSNVVVGNTTIAADSKTDTLTLEAGNNITLTPDSTNDKVTITASVPSPADATPLMDGTAAVGTSTDYAREDHIHPSDTSKLSLSGGTMTGPLAWDSSTALPHDTEPQYILGISAFAQGGVTKWSSLSELKTSLNIPTPGTLDTTVSSALATNSSESLGGSVSLHKVSKTGDYDDLNETPIFNEGGNIAIRDLIPYNDYTPLDYAISDSGTYIDTGIKPLNDDVEFDIRFKITSFYYSYFALFGDLRSSTGAQNFGLCFMGNKKLVLYNGQSSGIAVTNDIATEHIYHVVATLKSGSASLYVVDETAGTSETKTGTYTSATYAYNLNMLWRRYNGDNKMPNVYVYKAVARFRGAAAMNYIPAKRKSDSVGGFIDTVSGNFITGTTGSFTAGNEIDNKEYVISANQQLKFDDILSKPFTSKYTYWAPGAAVTAGWRKLASGLYCSNYLLIVRGTYSSGRPTVAGIAVSCYANHINLKQLWGTIYSVGGPSGFRLVETSTYTFDLEYYHGAVSSNPGTRYFSFIGLGALTIPDDAHTLVENQEVPSGTTTTQLDIRVMLDRPTVRTNLASTSSAYYDGRNITPGVTGTLPIGNGGTGGSTAKAAEYNLTTNLATALTTEIGDSYMIPFLATNPSTTNGRFAGYREASLFWNYINGKLGSVLGITAPTAYDGKEIVDELGTTYSLKNHYIDYSGTWVSSTTYGHYVIPMAGVRMVRLKAKSDNVMVYSFIKNYVFASPPTSDYAEGYTSIEQRAKGQEVELVVPSDAEYLFIYPGSKSSQPYKPDSIKLYGSMITRTHNEDVYYGRMEPLTAEDAVVSGWRDHSVIGMVPNSLIRYGYIGSTSGNYFSSNNTYPYYSAWIPLSKNLASVRVDTGAVSTRIAFLSKQGVYNGVAPYYCDGTTHTAVPALTTATFNVPSDAKYMYVFIGTLSNNVYSQMPKDLRFTGKRGAENFPLTINNTVYNGSYPVTFSGIAEDSNVVHLTGDETITDLKTFKDGIQIGQSTNTIIPIDIYADTFISGTTNIGVLQMSDNINDGAIVLRGINTPRSNSDAVNKKYVDDIVGDIETLLATI